MAHFPLCPSHPATPQLLQSCLLGAHQRTALPQGWVVLISKSRLQFRMLYLYTTEARRPSSHKYLVLPLWATGKKHTSNDIPVCTAILS